MFDCSDHSWYKPTIRSFFVPITRQFPFSSIYLKEVYYFFSCSRFCKGKGVSLHPHEGEYVILSRTAKQLIHWRQFAEDLGFPQKNPSVMLTDNSTSINLTKAPLIPAKSRHIALKHHHIRWAYKTNQIIAQHQGTNDIVPDAATKHVGPSRFLFFRKQLFHPPHTG